MDFEEMCDNLVAGAARKNLIRWTKGCFALILDLGPRTNVAESQAAAWLDSLPDFDLLPATGQISSLPLARRAGKRALKIVKLRRKRQAERIMDKAQESYLEVKEKLDKAGISAFIKGKGAIWRKSLQLG